MILERYILRNYLGPFFFSLSIITFVFIMDFILNYIDLFLGKGVPFTIVLQTFVLSLGHMFALIIPMAVLPATLMTFGNLASENEITAMKASGVSLYRMILPGTLGAVFLTAFLIFYNNFVLPDSNHKLLNLLIDINRKKPTVELKENQFIDDLKGYTIYFQGKDDRTGAISDVQIFRQREHGLPTTIVAATGRLKFLEPENVLRVDLYDGEIHELPVSKDRSTYRRTRFESYTLHIRDVDRSLQRTQRSYRGDREMDVEMMRDKIDQLRADIALTRVKTTEVATNRAEATFRLLDPEHRRRLYKPDEPDTTAAAAAARPRGRLRQVGGSARAAPAEARSEYITRTEIETQINKRESFVKQINRYRVEIHKKFSIPVACIVFVLVGSPLAIRMGRAGMNMAIGLSLLFFLVYYVCLIGGEKLADRGIVSPFVSMWAPNIFFVGLAVFMLREAAREQSVRGWSVRSAFNAVFRRNVAANSR
jgi:lipopolysaccharide export system permease protein